MGLEIAHIGKCFKMCTFEFRNCTSVKKKKTTQVISTLIYKSTKGEGGKRWLLTLLPVYREALLINSSLLERQDRSFPLECIWCTMTTPWQPETCRVWNANRSLDMKLMNFQKLGIGKAARRGFSLFFHFPLLVLFSAVQHKDCICVLVLL